MPGQPLGPTTQPARPARRVPNLLWPIALIVVGLAALLVNFDVVSLDQILRVLDLWPLALIVLGLVLIFRTSLPRLAAPLTAVVALLVVVAAVAYAALPELVPSFARAGIQQADFSTPLGTATSGRLELGLGAGTTTVEVRSISDLYQAHAEYPNGRPVQVKSSGGTVEVEGQGLGFPFLRLGSTGVRMVLNDSIPWEIHVRGGASSLTLDLSGAKLEALSVAGGASRVHADLPRPSGAVSVQISGGASDVELRRPEGVPVRVQMSGGAIDVQVDGEDFGRVESGRTYESPGYDTATDRYDINISGGASDVTIRTR